MEMMAFLRSEGRLSSLQEGDVCDMSGNKMKDMKSADIPKTVKALELRDNQLRKLDGETLRACKHLKFLGCSCNKLRELSGIGSVKGLVLIDASRNRLTSLHGIEKNKQLKEIFASHNQIENVGVESEMRSVTLLDLQANPISELDFGGAFPELFELYMDECRLKSLDGLAKFQRLQHFTARGNQISGAKVVKSSSLTNIDAADNDIQSLKPFTGMDALMYLNIQGNPITDEGLFIKRYKSDCLRELILCRTRISKLTPAMEMFPNIEVVDASHTHVDDINDVLEFVAGATQLRVLDTRFTPLTNGLYEEVDDDHVWDGNNEYNRHFTQEKELREAYREKVLSQCASKSMEVLDRIGVGKRRQDKPQKSEPKDRKQYVHEMIAKYERENQELRDILEASGHVKVGKADRLIRLLNQQNNLIRIEMGDVREVMAPNEEQEDTYPYVTQLIESLLEENVHLRGNTIGGQDISAHHKTLRAYSTSERTETKIRHSAHSIESSKHHKHRHHHHKHKKEGASQHPSKVSKRAKTEQEPDAGDNRDNAQENGSTSTTYYVPGAPPPATPQYPHDDVDLYHGEAGELDRYPYPLKKLKWLKFHPLPQDEEPCACFEPVEKKELQSIKRFEPDHGDTFEEGNYRREMGPWHDIPEKALPVMYPFNTTAIRKLPWDYEQYAPIRTRANKPKKHRPVLTTGYCEELIIKHPGNVFNGQTTEMSEEESEIVLFWVGSAIGFHRKVKQLSKFGFTGKYSSLESEYGCDNLVLVLVPCSDPNVYLEADLESPLVCHRFLDKLPSPIPHAYLLCAVSLGRQAIDRHDSLVPTNAVLKKVSDEGFNSLWFTRDGVASILIMDTNRVVPLYGIIMK